MVDAEANYKKVTEIFHKFGKQNPQFPKDLDLDYATLAKHANFGGLPAALKRYAISRSVNKKSMKKKKQVDFGDNGIFKDNSIITLIGDWNQDAQSQQLKPEDVKGKITSHEKAVI